jgi:hypothetical protein
MPATRPATPARPVRPMNPTPAPSHLIRLPASDNRIFSGWGITL